MKITWKMLTVREARRGMWLKIATLGLTAVSAAGQGDVDTGWYPAIRTEIAGFRSELVSRAAETDLTEDITEGTRAHLESQIEGTWVGLLRNLDAEIEGVEAQLSEARVKHSAQGNHFCSPRNIASRVAKRVMENPADANNALMSAAQCREAYWGASSRPVSEELESLRNLCRDRSQTPSGGPRQTVDSMECETRRHLRSDTLRSLEGCSLGPLLLNGKSL